MSDPRDRLIVALDVPSRAAAEKTIDTLGDAVTFYKIGMQLSFSGGLGLATDLAAHGKSVFLDMKLLDIPNTVSHAIEAIAASGVRMTTVHAYPQTMRAAAQGRGDSALKVLGVTVLTSLDASDLVDTGYASDLPALVERRAGQAANAGIDGLVCSPHEAATVRRRVGRSMLIVVPGVRPAGSAAGDQKRAATPADAIRAGADHVVVGRPILGAPDPHAAARSIVEAIDVATAGLAQSQS